MPFEPAFLATILPELILLSTACTVLIVDLYINEEQRGWNHNLAILGLAATLGCVGMLGGNDVTFAFSDSFIRDPFGDLLKGVILILTILTFVYSRDYMRERGLWVGEYHVLVLFAALGMLIMVSAHSFLTLYLGLELLALCLYPLVAMDRDSKPGAEAAMKYFVLGALGSGMLLYGISMLYGATGSFNFAQVAEAVASQGMDNKILVFGLVFVLIGVAFKFGAVPFHMWLPDVYQGAPMPIVLFLSSAPKIAAFAMASRILIDSLGALQSDWGEILIILSILSMGLGNIVAIAQTNIKRMLAYSTISHVGFIFLGLLAGTQEGYAAAMFYTVVYALMAAGAFGVLAMISVNGVEIENLDDLKGLNDRDAWLAAMLALMMFSMAGVPPAVGFFAKLLVLDAVVSIGLTWLAVVAVVFSIIGAFYYLRVVKFIYFDKPAEDSTPLQLAGDARIAISVNGLAVLFFGIFPASLLGICTAAFVR
ncbi:MULTISPECIES: NADH-quinone oxidoreductase subunit NuoN [Thiorhodovibrio]|uniref:NADH-quinone oxidoreductase subunit NuoN n=1 Tax=Thiorhodovibrio TaxID=61593 RepID=UPI0019135373|nr:MULTISPECIES: NADH-quinone oxidoreductase subunit NuoN [Thiorhodovibrio]MBK5970122.1 NADH-quinone oxidoreductase subunit N [Thiorhodovibrio winogradskyi]WPL13506.1 NADH-quinone oxidoreductase subunit N [Thiorhodovibrio litoralis]